MNSRISRIFNPARQFLKRFFSDTASSNRLQALFYQDALGIAICDSSGNWIKVNKRFAKMFELSIESIYDTNWLSISGIDRIVSSSPELRKNWDLLSIGKVNYFSLDCSFVRSVSKKHFWVTLTATAVSGVDGIPSSIVLVMRDVTEKIDAFNKAHENEEKYRLLAHAISDVIHVTSVGGNIIYISPSSKDMLGYTADELLGVPFLNLVHNNDLTQINYIADQKVSEKAGTLTTFRMRHKSGHYIWVECRLSPVFNEPEKTFNGYVGAIRDISSRVQVEDDLAASEIRYRLLFESMVDAFALHEIMLNEKGEPIDYIFLEVNQAFERLTGLKRENIIGKRVTEVLPSVEKELIDTYGEVALTGKSKSFKTYSQALDKHFEVTAFSPEKNQFAVTFTDIGLTVQAEEARLKLALQEERIQALNDFVANVTHDLKNPLSVIKIGIYLLERLDENPEKRAEKIKDVTDQIKLLERMIQDIVSVSKLDSLSELPFSKLVFDEIASSVIQAGKVAAADKNILLNYSLGAAGRSIMANELEIRRALTNLVDNAINYTPSGGSVTITTGCIDRDLFFEVTDTGIGIEEADRQRLFERFFRSDTVRRMGTSGTGLGLAIVNKVVSLHKGRVEVESEGSGKGSTFRVLIPIATKPTDSVEMVAVGRIF